MRNWFGLVAAIVAGFVLGVATLVLIAGFAITVRAGG